MHSSILRRTSAAVSIGVGMDKCICSSFPALMARRIRLTRRLKTQKRTLKAAKADPDPRTDKDRSAHR